MPCSDSSSSIALIINDQDQFIDFDFAKITCGREITAETGYNHYCVGKSIHDILQFPYKQIVQELRLGKEEEQFVFYLEWDALRSAIAQYLGKTHEDFDPQRCQITSIEHNDNETEIAMVILPPKELPKILPCSLGDNAGES